MWLRLMLATVILGVGMSVSPAAADTYQFPNNTYVWAYNGASPYPHSLGPSGVPNPPVSDPGVGYWYDRIGASVYEVYGVNIVGTTFQIYTNMPSGGDPQYNIPVADFFLDIGNDGSWDYAVNMYENPGESYNLGNIILLKTYQTSIDIFQNQTQFVYGGMYDADGVTGESFVPKPIPVQITSGDYIGDATVEWTYLGSSGPNYRIDIVLPEDFWTNQLADTTFAFIWGSGICANDTAQGVFKPVGVVVPLPGSVLLMGSGLLGLVALGRRIRRRR